MTNEEVTRFLKDLGRSLNDKDAARRRRAEERDAARRWEDMKNTAARLVRYNTNGRCTPVLCRDLKRAVLPPLAEAFCASFRFPPPPPPWEIVGSLVFLIEFACVHFMRLGQLRRTLVRYETRPGLAADARRCPVVRFGEMSVVGSVGCEWPFAPPKGGYRCETPEPPEPRLASAEPRRASVLERVAVGRRYHADVRAWMSGLTAEDYIAEDEWVRWEFVPLRRELKNRTIIDHVKPDWDAPGVRRIGMDVPNLIRLDAPPLQTRGGA